jgi:hypothetical protein
MTRRRAPNPRRLGGSTPDDSLLVRFFKAFTANYGTLLRVVFIVGVLAILDPLLTRIETSVDLAHEQPEPVESAPVAAEPVDMTPEKLPTDRELDKRWKHHLKCTSDKSYRDANFDDCFPDGTVVYERPKADEDDGSLLLFLEKDTLYATR